MAEDIRLPEEEKIPNIDVSDEDFEEYLKSLDELTLLEASSLKRSVDETIQQWKLCNEALANIGSASADKKLNNTIVEANILETVSVDTREEFAADYEKNINRLNAISDKLLTIIDEHKDEVNSTTYMTQQMIAILKRRMKALNEKEPNYEYELATGVMILKTFEYRLEGSMKIIDYLEQKLIPYLRNHRKEIARSMREETKLILNSTKTRAIKDLCRQFSEDTVAKFMYYLREELNDSAELVMVFTNFLAHLLKHGKSGGSDSYIKILILDFVDIYNGIYDIPDWSSSEYMDYFYEHITDPFSDYMSQKYSGSKYSHIISETSDCGVTPPMVQPAEDQKILEDMEKAEEADSTEEEIS